MTLKELKIFFELANNSQVSKIAKKLSLTQSAVSLAIKSLENKLGEKLFDRVGKRLVLNERGKYFLSLTKPYYLALNDALISFKNETLKGELSIFASRTIGDYILPQIVYKFTKRYPNVLIDTQTKNSKEIEQLVESGLIQIGFIENYIDNLNLIAKKLYKDELIVVTKNKTLANKCYYIDTLSKYTWLLREEGSGTREIFMNTLGKHTKEIKNSIVFSSFESIKRVLLSNNDTLTCISRICVEQELKDGKLFEIKLYNFKFERDFYLIYHKNKYKSLIFSEFIKFAYKGFMDI